MNLKDFQEAFVKGVLEGDFNQVSSFQEIINKNSCLSFERSFEVYQNDYRARLHEALGSTFETCWVVLGDELFTQYTSEYCRLYPSKTYDLNGYGEEFITFLKEREGEHEVPWLTELARFEWSFWKFFHQRKNKKAFPIAETDLLNFSYKDFEVFQCSFDFITLWQNREDSEFFKDKSLEDFKSATFIVLGKNHQGMVYKRIDDMSFRLLRELRKGQSMGEVIGLYQERKEVQGQNFWRDFFSLLKDLY